MLWPAIALSPTEAGEEIDRRVHEHMAIYGGRDYGRAMAAVLDEQPELKTAYSST